MTPDFWRGKRVFLTGHTGFKGGWLAIWLQSLGAQVHGYALKPATEPDLFTLARVSERMAGHAIADIRDAHTLAQAMRAAKPEIVFHLAAQPLVRAGYREPVATFASNIMGTVHVLEALRDMGSVRAAVMITTDKVYRSNAAQQPYREDDPLGGHDPYSASKAACEIVIDSYRQAFLAEQGIALASARAGNVIGGGDWSEDRLIPDAVRAWQGHQPLEIRRPDAIRPWQHVLEPLAGYLRLAEKLCQQPALAGAYNFGPAPHEAATVREVIELARTAYGTGDVHFGDGSAGPFEAGWLALDIARAQTLLDVNPRWTLNEAVTRTMRWYRAQHAGADARALCEDEIAAYTQNIAVSPARPAGSTLGVQTF
ncbi:MAG: CDP-glucose 4,6-dehydratase [Rugosibacter sp.]|nr:CDP-glucose 4,6-dehydratase [Rugosibacter sp.]